MASKTAKEVKVNKTDKIKILFVASEGQPFIASGGLGDVIGSLPKAIAKSGDYDVRVVLPLYSLIADKYRKEMKYLGSTSISLSWRHQYAGVFSYEADGVTFYFIDNEYYFKRSGIYGYLDEAERFAFFSRAALEILPIINFVPQIIHCHDWQTALIPVYLKANYAFRDTYKNIRTLFTIHNMEYQGRYSMDLLYDLFELPDWSSSLVENDGDINLMKGAIQCADMVSTVSESYAKEITEPSASCGLMHIIRQNEYKLVGIMNGIDYNFYNPSNDASIFENFDVKSASEKVRNKLMLQELLNLPCNADVPMLAMISRLVTHKGIDLVKAEIEHILEGDVQFVVLGTGEYQFEEFFKALQAKYPDKMRALIEFNPQISRKLYAACDIFLMPSKNEPCGLSQMIASRYGAVPVVRKVGGLADSIRDYGDGGNGFTFVEYNAMHMYDSVRRALALYGDKEKWTALREKAMTTDFSWGRSAKEYDAVYDRLLADKI